MKIIALFLLSNINVFARITDNQIEIKIDKQQVEITTKKDFHLNAEAPASIIFEDLKEELKPKIKTEKTFIFDRNEKADSARLSFYVCDNKKTVCEQHKKEVNFKNGKIQTPQTKTEYNNIKEFNLKSINSKPTLLVFSAPWCPACIRMQTETYIKPEVKKQLNQINFIKLNSDLTDNYELSQKFKIRAIPTIILLDKDGNEAYRWLDFQNPKEFSISLNQELKKIDHAATLLAKAQLGDIDAASALAYKYYYALDYSEAFKWFSLTKSEKDQKYKFASEVQLAQEKADVDSKLTVDYLNVLEKAIILTTSKLDQIRWKIDFFEKKKELKLLTDDVKVAANSLVVEIDNLFNNKKRAQSSFIESTYGNYSGFEKEELLWLKSRLYGILDMSDEKLNTNAIAIRLLEKKKLIMAKPGEVLLAISYLKEAGDTNKVEFLYNQLINKYSNSYVYYEKYARFLQKNKKFEKALTFVNESLRYPEGNEPQLNLLKSQILKDLNKKPEAMALIAEILSTELIQHKKFSGTKKRLIELNEEISK